MSNLKEDITKIVSEMGNIKSEPAPMEYTEEEQERGALFMNGALQIFEKIGERVTVLEEENKALKETAKTATTKFDFIIWSIASLATGWNIDMAKASELWGVEFVGVAQIIKWIAEKIK